MVISFVGQTVANALRRVSVFHFVGMWSEAGIPAFRYFVFERGSTQNLSGSHGGFSRERQPRASRCGDIVVVGIWLSLVCRRELE